MIPTVSATGRNFDHFPIFRTKRAAISDFPLLARGKRRQRRRFEPQRTAPRRFPRLGRFNGTADFFGNSNGCGNFGKLGRGNDAKTRTRRELNGFHL